MLQNIRKIPVASTPFGLGDLVACFKYAAPGSRQQGLFAAELSSRINKRHLFFLNSGLACFYLLLKILKERYGKSEVILPAYTALALVVAVKKAGLKPVLCDISLEDFNMDCELLSNAVTERTLCIMGIHMFGIPLAGLDRLKSRYPGVFMVEDCAQALGSSVGDSLVGGQGDASFFSFNRGKNLPTYGGGCLATDDEGLAVEIKKNIEGMQEEGWGSVFPIAVKLGILSVVINPVVYGLMYSLISRFKETAPPDDFEVRRYTEFQAAAGLRLMKRLDTLSRLRYRNGMSLIEGLGGVQGVVVPKIQERSVPAFNRFPILLEDAAKMQEAHNLLWRNGIESSRMYIRPLHHAFELGYGSDNFKNATYCAEHLLALPVHPGVGTDDIRRMIDSLRDIFQSRTV